jgi:maleylpyruvate isomerase
MRKSTFQRWKMDKSPEAFLKLYSYFRSSASFRVRIALNLKQLPYETIPVHLLRDGGQQFAPDYRRINHDALLPTLVDGDEALVQSLAIIEYLEESYPTPPLLPQRAIDRAYVRSIAQQVACEIHPLNNLRVLRYLKHNLKVADDAKDAWYRHWVEEGFATLERRMAGDPRTGSFAFGDAPTLADLCIVPQIFNAQRFNIDMTPYPTLQRIHEHALRLPAFAAAVPAEQPDAE